MDFGPVPLARALGAILAHSHSVGGRRLRKGQRLEQADLDMLEAEGVTELTVARLGPGDLGEDAAAERLARALVPDPDAAGLTLTPATTGRVNLKAAGPGIVELDAAAIHALNRIDPAITFATLRPYARVSAGTLVGTVKIISYAVAGARLEEACAHAAGSATAKGAGAGPGDGRAIRLQPVTLRSAGLLMTAVPGQAPKLNAKGREATRKRLAALGMTLAGVAEVPHEAAAIAAALPDLPGDLVLILTGSATSDLHDTGPEGLRAAGGRVERFGMPVDPGNLLFLGRLGPRPVIGLPGCARSPALNGADWVLDRIACGLEVDAGDIAAMGVGGLLKEAPTRPHPRGD